MNLEMSAISEKNAHFTAKDFQDDLIEGTKHLNGLSMLKGFLTQEKKNACSINRTFITV